MNSRKRTLLVRDIEKDCNLRIIQQFYIHFSHSEFNDVAGCSKFNFVYCDHCQEKLNLLHPALKFTIEKEQNNSLHFLDVLVEKEGTGFLTSIYRKPRFTGQYIRWNSFSRRTRKISLIKTLVHRALMICSKTKLGPELDKIKQLLIENGYPVDVLLSCINQKLANFAAEKPSGPEKCPVCLKLPWIGNVSSKLSNQ